MSAPRTLALLGRDYPDLGPLAVTGLPDGGALGLSRGAHPKAYRYLDPNEDAALLVRTPRGVLLAVADGRNGVAASELAIDATRRCAADLIGAHGDDFRVLARQLIEALRRGLSGVGPSRTCLVLASIRERECHFALFGDCSLWRARHARPPTVPNQLILGPGLRLQGMPADLWSGSFELEDTERVALVSDGVTNFVPDLAAIPRLLGQAGDDPAAVSRLAETAMIGGAGDNIAIAVAAAPARAG